MPCFGTWQGQGDSNIPMESKASLSSDACRDRSISEDVPGTLANVLADLNRAKVMFQLRTIEAIIRGPHITGANYD